MDIIKRKKHKIFYGTASVGTKNLSLSLSMVLNIDIYFKCINNITLTKLIINVKNEKKRNIVQRTMLYKS